MSSEWKSTERVKWLPAEDRFLVDQIKRNARESHMDLARKIISHPMVSGRSIGAVEQRIGWLRARLRHNSSLPLPEPEPLFPGHEILQSLITAIWINEIARDYDCYFLLKEDTLKNAIYYHLRRKLGEDYLLNHHLRIFTEYMVGDQRIDLVVARIDEDKAESSYLQHSVDRIVVAMELKYKSGTDDQAFKNDIRKIIDYIRNPDFNGCHFFLGFIQEVSFDKSTNFSWLNQQQRVHAKGRLTELNHFIDEGTGTPIWDVVKH